MQLKHKSGCMHIYIHHDLPHTSFVLYAAVQYTVFCCKRVGWFFFTWFTCIFHYLQQRNGLSTSKVIIAFNLFHQTTKKSSMCLINQMLSSVFFPPVSQFQCNISSVIYITVTPNHCPVFHSATK